MLHFRQALRRCNDTLQVILIELVCGGASRSSTENGAHGNNVIFFLHILMNRIVGKASQRKSAAGEVNLDLIGGGQLPNAVEDGSSLILREQCDLSLCPCDSVVKTNSPCKRGPLLFPEIARVPHRDLCPSPAVAGPCRNSACPRGSTGRGSRSRPANSRTQW